MFTGTLALTAFWSARAREAASCAVRDSCPDAWYWPDPPLPAPPPLEVDWLCGLLWLVLDELLAEELLLLLTAWLAELLPPLTSPPAMFTGTLALTAFWWALAWDRAACSVADAW